MMDPFVRRPLGRSQLRVPALGFGGAPLGDLYVKTSEEQARDTMNLACDAGIRYFDTSPYYGLGLSERRIGSVLYRRPREDFIVSTKVGRLLRAPIDLLGFATTDGARPWLGGLPFERTFDYSYRGIVRSFEDSLQRLALNRVDMLVIHDLDSGHHPDAEMLTKHFADLASGGLQALAELRASGFVGAIGVGVNRLGTIPRFLDLFDPDFFLVALPYTLAEQPALDE